MICFCFRFVCWCLLLSSACLLVVCCYDSYFDCGFECFGFAVVMGGFDFHFGGFVWLFVVIRCWFTFECHCAFCCGLFQCCFFRLFDLFCVFVVVRFFVSIDWFYWLFGVYVILLMLPGVIVIFF